MAQQTGCVVCKSAQCMLVANVGHKSRYECEVCGRYDASDTVLETTLNPQHDQLTTIQRAVLSHRIREANDARRETPLLTTYEVDDLIANGRLPSPAQQAINIVRFVGDRVAASGEPISNFPAAFHASVGSPNRNSAMHIARQLFRAGLLDAIEAGDMQSPNEIIQVIDRTSSQIGLAIDAAWPLVPR